MIPAGGAGVPPDQRGTITVVGLGPAGADLLTAGGRAALERAGRRFTRTARHPAVDDLAAAGLSLESFDAVYEAGEDPEAIYGEMVRRLLEASAGGDDVAFAVPGSPTTGERAVALLRRAVPAGRLVVVPGLSFVDLAWTRLGVDPLDGGRVVDGKALPAALPAGPLLVSHCHSRLVLSDVKLALLERLDPQATVTVLARLGLPDEQVAVVPLAILDHGVEPDHLTSLFVEVPPGGAGDAWEALVSLVERLRAPGGCPWDAEQTHATLARHLVEETYEVVEAIDALPVSAPGGAEPVPAGAYEALEEELGDLACQVVFHAVFAREAGAFTVTDVLCGIHDKLVRRHPHVFGDVTVSGADEVVANWEQIKRAEKGRKSIMDGVPGSLPSLLYAHKLYRKASSAGLDLAGDALEQATDGLATLGALLDAGAGIEQLEQVLGETLGALVGVARGAGADAETALRGWAGRFRSRFEAVEAAAAGMGATVKTLPDEELVRLWHEQARSNRPQG